MVKDAETHADDDRRQREVVEARNNAENAAYQAEKQLEELGDSVDDSSKEEITAAIADVRGRARVRGPGRDQRQGRGAADRVPQGVGGDVRQRRRRSSRPTPTTARSANGGDADGSAEEEVVDAEVVDDSESR